MEGMTGADTARIEAAVADLRRKEKQVEGEESWLKNEIDRELRKTAAGGWNRKVEQAFTRIAALDAGLRYTSQRLEKIVANREAKEKQLAAMKPREKGK